MKIVSCKANRFIGKQYEGRCGELFRVVNNKITSTIVSTRSMQVRKM